MKPSRCVGVRQIMTKTTSRAMLIAVLSLIGCSDPPGQSPTPPSPAAPPPAASTAPATYQAETFRADIERLISAKRYRDAVALVEAADVNRQVEVDGGGGYVAVAVDMILLPGVYPATEYKQERDWVFPGTSDAIEDMDWQRAAEAFAERYNVRRRTVSRIQ